MTDNTYMGQSLDIILGQEFLTWLWYKSDTSPDNFYDSQKMPFRVMMEQKIVVQGGEGENLETTSVSGSLSPLRDARFGLVKGKQVVKAQIRLEKDELSWQIMLKSSDLSLNSFKIPKVEKIDDDEDQDAQLLEKIYLWEIGLKLVDSLYKQYLDVRLTDGWNDEVKDMNVWIKSITRQ